MSVIVVGGGGWDVRTMPGTAEMVRRGVRGGGLGELVDPDAPDGMPVVSAVYLDRAGDALHPWCVGVEGVGVRRYRSRGRAEAGRERVLLALWEAARADRRREARRIKTCE